ncbi:MAG TPA: hypothetical protein VFE42_27195 [Chloroflexota bacterium]|nr:hypothetical protein [Chloroflexota bacterium]
MATSPSNGSSANSPKDSDRGKSIVDRFGQATFIFVLFIIPLGTLGVLYYVNFMYNFASPSPAPSAAPHAQPMETATGIGARGRFAASTGLIASDAPARQSLSPTPVSTAAPTATAVEGRGAHHL